MGIVQIGARLVKSFGSGKNLRKVVTEFTNGKTYTKVLDADGNILKDRVKQIVRGQQVGDKKVNTVTKVTKELREDMGGTYDYTEKLVYDRVYSKDGKFLGSRAAFYDPFHKTAVLKNCVGGNSFLKNFREVCLGGKVTSKQIGVPAGEAPLGKMHGITKVYYNDKGLPMPSGIASELFHGCNLQQMRIIHLLKRPDLPYAPNGLGLEFLDKPTESLAAMNNLDSFI